jgi:5-methylcytosine-specific restriction endonuclease McrA
MKALVLNQDYSPISICSIQRAFVLVFMEKVDMVETFNGNKFHTINNAYPVPAVIRLQRYINIPYKSVELTRNNIFKRDNFECQYCESNKELTLDHLIPRSKGGKSTWKNLVTACKSCNSVKGDVSPEAVGFALKADPFKPSYIMFLRDFSGYRYEEWMPFLGSNQPKSAW